MTRAIRHRGPDDEGYVFFAVNNSKPSIFGGNDTPENVYQSAYPFSPKANLTESDSCQDFFMVMGHRRLSIIDLTPAAHQPMSSGNGRYWIVYNGEIYNFREIRNELIGKGEIFRSDSDTEVILKSYKHWGADCLNYFNGMWAFVIYDHQNNEIFISRDRFGIKPLYYYHDGEVFLFASEIKAILAHPMVETTPNYNYCMSYIQTAPREFIQETAFNNIYRFNYACYVLTKPANLIRGDLNFEKYWEVNPNLSDEPYDPVKARQYEKRYRELLFDSVKLRLRADVKVGSALSGGLDSSSVVYYVNQNLKELGAVDKQETFSNIYKEEGTEYCDESRFINILVKELNLKSNSITPITKDVPEEHRKAIYALENPPGGPQMSNWYTFKCVSSTDVKVTLDGQGADEQMAGYLYYLVNHIARLNLKEALRDYKAFKNVPQARRFLNKGLLFCATRKIIGEGSTVAILKHFRRNRSPYTPLNEILHEEFTKSLVTLLHYGDRVSMAHSIESRMPFMDYRLVSFLAEVPAVYKLHAGWTKYLARAAMDKLINDEICWRVDKKGWPNPSEYWFRGPLKEWFCSTIENSSFLKELGIGSDIRKRIEDRKSIKRLTRLLNLAVWYDIFFKEKPYIRTTG